MTYYSEEQESRIPEIRSQAQILQLGTWNFKPETLSNCLQVGRS